MLNQLLIVMLLSFTNPVEENLKLLTSTTEGQTMEYKVFNRRGKLTGYSVTNIKSVERNEQNELVVTEVVYSYDGEMIEENKDELIMTAITRITNDKMILDNESLFPPGMMDNAPKGASMVVKGNMEYPLSITVGETIPDCVMQMIMVFKCEDEECKDEECEDMEKNFITMSMINRSVLAKEVVETPAGSFECYKITETMKITCIIKILGSTQTVVTWLAPGIGAVKSETYNKRGKLEEVKILNAIR